MYTTPLFFLLLLLLLHLFVSKSSSGINDNLVSHSICGQFLFEDDQHPFYEQVLNVELDRSWWVVVYTFWRASIVNMANIYFTSLKFSCFTARQISWPIRLASQKRGVIDRERRKKMFFFSLAPSIGRQFGVDAWGQLSILGSENVCTRTTDGRRSGIGNWFSICLDMRMLKVWPTLDFLQFFFL